MRNKYNPINISDMKIKANPNKSQIKTQRKRFSRQKLVAFFQENYRGDIYKTLQAYAYYIRKLFKTQRYGKISISIPRSLLGKFVGCHVDTISSCNLRLEEAGILSFQRAYKQVNVITCSFIHALLEFFGYLPEWLYFRLKSTSLLDSSYLNYLNTISLETLRAEFLNFLNPKRENLGNFSSSNINCPPELCTRPPVLRPFGDTCYIRRDEQCSHINTNLLFKRKEDEDPRFPRDEQFKVDWGRVLPPTIPSWIEKAKQRVKKIDFQKTQEYLLEMVKNRWNLAI